MHFSLPNGLQVVHHFDPDTNLVAVNVLYNVGARNDPRHLTGMAHLMEHLMFGGSVNIPNFDSALELAGGSNNAWTSDDFTNFWDCLPAQNVETALWLESDRMLSLAFSPESLETQRKVVIEEFKQVCLNTPYGDLSHHLRRMLFAHHPYRYPTIGREPAHIEAVTLDDVKRFYFSHYAPNNAILAIAGNIDLPTTRRLVDKWFADIPRRPIRRRPAPDTFSAAPLRPHTQVIEAPVPLTNITIAFPMGGFTDTHYIGADLLTDILAAGQASRFYTRLLAGSHVFSSVDASIAGLEERGYLMVNAILRPDADVDHATSQIWAELQRAIDAPPTARELRRVLNNYESAHVLNRISCLARAQQMAIAAIHGEDTDTRLRRYLATTPSTIHAAARAIIDLSRAQTLIYRPIAP